MKMPWVEAIFDAIGNLWTMRCKVYTKTEKKENLLVPKQDSFENMWGRKKNEERVKVVDVKCAHAKNETKFV